ncbi:hypothetical protein NBRC116583_35220 [Arenicella sp. 4NH20-0111]
MQHYFQKIVFSSLILYVFLLVNPILFPREYSTEIINAYSWSGYGGLLNPRGILPYLLSISMVASLIGISLYDRRARKALLFLYTLNLILLPLWGIHVSGPLDGLLSSLINVGLVSTLVLSYTSLDSFFD